MNSKQQPIPTPKDNYLWDGLQEIHKNLAAYSLVPGVLIPFFRNKELIAKVENQKELLDQAQILNNDVAAFSQSLQGIYEKHKSLTGSANTPDDRMSTIQIYEEYVAWAQSYESVVLPTIETICGIFETAGGDVTALRQPAPSDVIDGAIASQTEA